MRICTASGIRQWKGSKKRRVSLVDHISFLVMRRHHLVTAFAFDLDFTAAGFRLFAA
jgi:predicted nucleic acid-binding protein